MPKYALSQGLTGFNQKGYSCLELLFSHCFLGEFPVTHRAYLEIEAGDMTKEASRVMPPLKLKDVWKMMCFFDS